MITPTQEYQRTHLTVPRSATKGLDAMVDHAVGQVRRRSLGAGALLADAVLVDELAEKYAPLTDRRLREKLTVCRTVIRRFPEPNDQVIFCALAAIREAAVRKLGMCPYPVQIAGALALYRGFLAEMATGEGKTLAAVLPAVLFGWSGAPCHIVTVNDYLAQRDAEWMAPLYAFCGVRAGFVTGAMGPEDRRAGYAQDVTYCTSKEIVADFLRDRLHLGTLQNPTRRQLAQLRQPGLLDHTGLVMRGLHTAIIDEADSVLVDEAVTPVIISSQRPNEMLKEACRMARGIADTLAEGEDYEVNRRYREIEFKPAAKNRVTQRCEHLPGLWRAPGRRLELVKQAVTARELFHEHKQYVVQEGKVVIIDEFTGRMMPQRTWREGLHQAIEAKAGLDISDPSETLARLSFQRFFRFFSRVSGMTGTAWEAADEFWHIYRLPVVTIPTNKPCIRQELPDRAFADHAAKWNAVAEEIVRLHQTGRPLLIGTQTIRDSELLAERLQGLGLEYRVLNAVRHREEAHIVAEAGQMGRITISTNMAGRGTDIRLGRGVAQLGGLHVLATERHESRRIDRQLFGRSGRQGDPGSSQAFVSAEDALLHRFVPVTMRRQLEAATRGSFTGSRLLATAVFAYAQRSARRLAARQRAKVLKTDTWMEDALSFAGLENE